jgi:hypothetical protein
MLLDPSEGKPSFDFQTTAEGEGSNLHFSACGEYLVGGSWGGLISVRSVNTGEVVYRKEFPGDMLVAVHRFQNGHSWMVQHNPRATTSDAPPAPGYFSLWSWPFADNAFAIAPCRFPFARSSAATEQGDRLAVVHGAPPTSLTVVRLADGEELATLPVRCGGSGWTVRWSRDGKLLGSVQKDKIVFYETERYSPVGEVSLPFPSDVSFSPVHDVVGLGSWSAGLALPLHEVVGAGEAG